ncbi:MAG TPA: hypothetical protein VGH80_00205 [Xanthomonadaceae bacterium]|jgi:hypothetical protein
MTQHRTIQCVGSSEEDTAHLRLLLRVAKMQLHDTWVWGTESKADLVVVDARRLVGETAMRRAQQRGVAWAQIIDIDDPAPSCLYLRKPFRSSAFLALLNAVGQGATVAEEGSGQWHDEFAELDLGHVDLSSLEAAHPGVQNFTVRRQEEEEKQPAPAFSQPVAPPVVPEVVPGPGASAEQDAANAGAADAEAGARALDAAYGHDTEIHIDKKATYPLIYYLEKGVLRGPMRIELPGAPGLVLDPEEQIFLARGLLRALEPYASEPLRYGDFKRLTHSEFEVARRSSAARPYVRLIWMDSFLHSDGFLAKHLDPGGSYRLTNKLDLAGDYPRAFRVATHMTVSRKLHEIARMSAVGLAEVFDVVNAYDTIGYIEWTPREGAQRGAPARK